MAYVGTLAVNVVANTGRFRTGLRTAGRDVKMFSGTVMRSSGVLGSYGSMLSAGIGVGATSAVVSGMVRMGKATNEFTGTMNRSLAIIQDVGAGMRIEMEKTAHVVAQSTQYSATEAARAYFYLASAGMDAKQSVMALNQVALFAQAGNFSLAEATDLATDAQSAMGLKSVDAATNLKNLTYVTDVLTRANTLGNASIQQFSESLTNQAGAAAKVYGLSMESALSMLAAFADQGVKGADAGTKFGIVLRDLTTKAILNREAFEKSGIAVYEFGEVRTPTKIFADIEKAMAGMTGEQKKMMLLQHGFTNKTVAATQSLIGYADFMANAEAEMKKAGITAKGVAEDSLTPLDKAWNRMSGSMNQAATEFFPPILDGLAEMITGLSGVEKGLDGVTQAQSNWTKAGKAVVDTVAMVKYLKELKDATNIWGLAFDYEVGEMTGQNLHLSGDVTGFPSLVIEVNRWWEGIHTELMDSLYGVKSEVGMVGGMRQEDWIARQSRPSSADHGVPTGQYKAMMIAKREAAEKEDAANRRSFSREVGSWGKGIGAAVSKGMATGTKWLDNASQQDQARLDMIARHLTPEETYTAKLESIDRLLSIFSDGTFQKAAGLESQAARDEYLKAIGKDDKPPVDTGFTPAMLAGSAEAYETLQRNLRGGISGPAEQTAEAAKKIEARFPALMTAMSNIAAALGKPGTVETTP